MHGILFPPADDDQRDLWRSQLHQWRDVTRALMGYDGRSYELPEYRWMSCAFSVGFLMLFDTRFYDPTSGHYRIDALLDQAEIDYGGFDAILLWYAYPKIGFDTRNQFDFYRDAVGGLEGLRALVERCHERGVRVYIDYNPWDRGTRPEGQPDSDALVDLVHALDADAIFLDTLAYAAEGLREKLDAVRPGVVLESEHLLPVEQIETHHASWAQGLPESNIPGVLRNKWFERRHMQHRIKRWQRDHTEELHLAWMNGTGVVVWENVFGTDLRWSPRDKSILRAMLPIQRRYADLFCGEGWQPLIETEHESIVASLWEDGGLRLWTLCNLGDTAYSGDLLRVAHDGQPFYDLTSGVRLSPAGQENQVVLSGSIRPRGIGAILSATGEHVDAQFDAFLANQKSIDGRANFDPTPPAAIEVLTPVPEVNPISRDAIPPDMAFIPGRAFDLNVQFQVRECGFYGYGLNGTPPLDLRYRNLHRVETLSRAVSVEDFALDLTPVTNAQYAAFLQATGYRPANSDHFLAHWPDGILPSALETHPVVYVDLEDARAYARWIGKRLPTEEEWQHAAQGEEERVYPWGNEYAPERCNHGASGTTTPVNAYPEGRSPSGIFDLCGNVWEMTESERWNGSTRFCILKGGSFYRATGSEWYADGGAKPNAFSAKFILSWSGLDRCATIGFRCAAALSL